jgi:hypothetical protein
MYKIFILTSFFCCSSLFADATVISGGGPSYPLQIDAVMLNVHNGYAKDSFSIKLPASFYTDFRDNVDSVYTYADAFRKRRNELSAGSNREDTSACLIFSTLGLPAMRFYFYPGQSKSGRLLTSDDKYPFVIVLTKGFSTQLAKLLKKKK